MGWVEIAPCPSPAFGNVSRGRGAGAKIREDERGFLVGVLALTSSGCSGPSEAAGTLCAVVEQELGAPPNGSVAGSARPTPAPSTPHTLASGTSGLAETHRTCPHESGCYGRY